jgi:hypothetical protein
MSFIVLVMSQICMLSQQIQTHKKLHMHSSKTKLVMNMDRVLLARNKHRCACHGVLLTSPCTQFDQGLTRFLGPISLRKLQADSERKSPSTIITELASMRGSEQGWWHVYVLLLETLPKANLTLEIEQGDRDL